MTETLTAPPAVIDYQAVAIGNIRMMLSLRGLKQSDLAAYMGKHRQNLNRMINTGAQWSFNDMCRAAQFFGVSIDTLMRPDLTQSELKGNGGLPVVNVDDFRLRGGRGRPRLWFWPPDRAARDHNPEVHGSNPCPATDES